MGAKFIRRVYKIYTTRIQNLYNAHTKKYNPKPTPVYSPPRNVAYNIYTTQTPDLYTALKRRKNWVIYKTAPHNISLVP